LGGQMPSIVAGPVATAVQSTNQSNDVFV